MLPDDSERAAARIERRTDRILAISGSMFLIWQLGYFVVFSRPVAAFRRVDVVASLGFIAWSAALLMLVATGGGAFRSADVRAILDDERARSERAQACQNAFWGMLLAAFAGYVAAHFTTVSALSLAHVILSSGVLIAVATLAYVRRQ